MAYSDGNLKNNGQKPCPYFVPFLTGNVSVKHSAIQALLYVLFKHILINEINVSNVYWTVHHCNS